MFGRRMNLPLVGGLIGPAMCGAVMARAELPQDQSAITVNELPSSGAGVPLISFASFSIEFSSFPDFAGNLSHPNEFSNNLLNNMAEMAGLKPYIRVGGNTQDYAIFNKTLKVASVGIINPARSTDYPTTLTIGPSYFESYLTWPGTKFSHGFNLAKNSTADRAALLESVPYACKALSHGNLAFWELGNEPDLYKTSSQGPVRPPSWNEQDYVAEWLKWSRAIHGRMQQACPWEASAAEFKFIAPSFAGSSNSLNPVMTWQDGLDADKDIALISSHNYISGADVPGVTLQGTLMNHSSTVASVTKQLNEARQISALGATLDPHLPYILGETNSLYNEGRPGLSNTFGATLWGVDFNLYCAANNIRRVHMHQGTNYRYQAWQPIETNVTTKGTKAPYYGSMTVASFLGKIGEAPPSVVNLPLPNELESAYASYVQGRLRKLIVINMMGYNTTADNPYQNHYPRPVEQYTFQMPPCAYDQRASLQRLMANGSDAITGVTFDGFSYNYDLDNGRPVLLHNVTRGETAQVSRNGKLVVSVPRSSAVILNFE